MVRSKNCIKIGDEVTTLKIGMLEKKSKITNIRLVLENGNNVELEEVYLTKPEEKTDSPVVETSIEHQDGPSPSPAVQTEPEPKKKTGRPKKVILDTSNTYIGTIDRSNLKIVVASDCNIGDGEPIEVTPAGVLCPNCKQVLTTGSPSFIEQMILTGKNTSLYSKCNGCKRRFYFDKKGDQIVYKRVSE